MLAAFRTSPMESGPVRSGPVLREHQMGRKSPRTRSIESIGARQTSCRLPDSSREDREEFRVARQLSGACVRRALPEIACADSATVTSSEVDEPLRPFTNLRACSYYGCPV